MPLSDFLSAYRGREAQQNAAPMQELQQMGALQNILAQIRAAQDAPIKSEILRQQLEEHKNKVAQGQMLSNLPQAQMEDPAFLRRLGVAMNKPEFISRADALEKKQADAALLKQMQGVETPVARMTTVPSGNQALDEASAIAQLKSLPPGQTGSVQQVLPGEQPTMPAMTTRTGGLFDSLTQSKIPQIAAQAQQMKAALERSGPSIPAQYWQTQQEKLADKETALLNRPEPIKIVLGADGKPTYAQGRDAIVGATPATAAMSHPEANLDPSAIESAAARYRIDGTLPTNLGRGTQGAANTAAILKKAAESAAADGMTPEAQRLTQISNKASAQALGQLTKQKNLILAFEKTAQMNADLVLQESSKVDRLGSPVIDRWILAGKKAIAGDPGVARLDTAVRTFVNEYARVTTSVTGGGITSDTARREIETLLQAAHTPEQVKQTIDLMKTELNNRKVAYEQQERELRGSITGGGQPAQQATAPAPAGAPKTRIRFDAQGNMIK